MPKMRIFYDYECPYCKRGYEDLMTLAGDYPEIEIEWRPVESHPRPEDHPPHTDLCIQAFYAAVELNADLPKFHAAMFQAAAVERKNVERLDVLTAVVEDLADPATFRSVIESGKYAGRAAENNDLAYEREGVWYVPAFRMNGKKLDARGGIGVSREELRAFLAGGGGGSKTD
jgi:predicted DsbA family dithiol-disulfide isomerase